MSWTDDQTLICITQDGSVYMYNIDLESANSVISMGKECFTHSVVECVFWGNGVVCMNEVFELFCIQDFKNPRPCKLADVGIEEFPLCMAVIEPQYTMSGNVEVLVSVGDQILTVDEDGVQQVSLEVGPIQKMAVSQNAKFLAGFTHDGRLVIMKTDLSDILFDYTCEVS